MEDDWQSSWGQKIALKCHERPYALMLTPGSQVISWKIEETKVPWSLNWKA